MFQLEVMQDLAELKAELCAKIDAEAGQARLQFITDAPGQSMVYQEKRREAELIKAAIANGDTMLVFVDCPHLEAEAAERGISLEAMSTEVLNAAWAWAQVSPAIEIARLAAKKSVNSATTAVGARAAANVDWHSILPSEEN